MKRGFRVKLGGAAALFTLSFFAGGAAFAGDFDGDGLDDLAIGAPQEVLGGNARSGAAFLFRGRVSGLTPVTVLDQGSSGLGANETGDEFGTSFAAGDFDGDGRDDLAIGAPGEAPGTGARSGVVFLFLEGNIPDRVIDQTGLGANEAGDRFGQALVAGDFDGDGFDDLAVGAPGEAPGSDPKSGGVFLFLGSENGLVAHAFIDQSGLGMNELDDLFGSALSAGDFDADGRDDLAVGAPGEAPGTEPRSGAVFVFEGTDDGLAPKDVIVQGALGQNEHGDLFGSALASGDFDGDGQADLAVGAPGEAPGSDPRSGGVFVFRGPALQGERFLDQSGLGSNEAGDELGSALSSGDFNGDGRDDLAVGAPGEAPGAQPKSGAAFVFRGTAVGLVPDTFLVQSGLSTNQHGERFGAALASGDFNGDARDDLAIGAPGEGATAAAGPGGVFVFRGTAAGLSPEDLLDQSGLGANEPGDRFGAALSE